MIVVLCMFSYAPYTMVDTSTEETNRQYALWSEYNEMRRSVPCPHNHVLAMACFALVQTAGSGEPEHTLWYRDLIEEARKEYLTALRIAPNLAEAHFSLGNLYLREGKLEDASRHLSEAVQANPEHAGARTNLGVTLGRQGNIQEAIGQLEKSVALKPDAAEARDNLARAYWVSGKGSEALRELASVYVAW